jgi:hypothetical protein
MPYILQNINPVGQKLSLTINGEVLELQLGQTQAVNIRSKTNEINKLAMEGWLAVYYVDAMPEVRVESRILAPLFIEEPVAEVSEEVTPQRKKSKTAPSEEETN